jgi:hypothetical protein
MHISLKRRLAGTAIAAAGLTIAGLASPAQAADVATAAHAATATVTSHYTPPAGITAPCAATTSSAVSCAVLTGKPAKSAAKTTAGKPAVSAASTTTITGFTPTELQAAYEAQGSFTGSAAGSGETVAVVTAYDDPDAASDLATYRSEYGLEACTVADGCFEKVSETGSTTDLPASASGWSSAASESMDMISAICPNCHILLVEANSPDISDLGTAVNEAVTLGAKFVDTTWYESEASIGSAETTYDSEYFDHPGVAITAPAGDGGYGVNYPAASPYVIAVGGTSLTTDSSSIPSGYTQTAWTGSGSGCSAYEPKPAWQTDTSTCAGRTLNDLAAVADPNTPVAYYDTPTEGGWAADGGGGTAVAAAIVAALYALAGAPAAGTWPAEYPYEHPGGSYTTPGNAYPYIDGLDNITAETGGVTETCSPSYLCNAGPGYNGPTGLGAPFTTLSLTSTGGENGVIYGGEEGICIDDTGGVTTAGNPVQIYQCNGHATQDWIVEPDGTIRYAADTSDCMYITLAATQVGAGIELAGCNTSDGGMQWIPLSNGTYYNPRSAKCLYDSDGTTNGTQLEINNCNAASRTEVWNVPYTVPSATGEITSDLGSTECVDDFHSGTTSGNTIDLYGCNQTSAQSWTTEPGGTLEVLGGCMSLDDDGNTSGTKVVYSGCSGDPAQRWIERSDGSLYNWFSNACLDDTNASTTNGNPLQIYSCNGEVQQSWNPPNY